MPKKNISNHSAITLFPERNFIDTTSFVKTYKNFLVRIIAHGHPSEDTKTMYFSQIDNFLRWSQKNNKVEPLQCQKHHITTYRDYLYNKNLKEATISFKLTAIRKFYQAAQQLALISSNPADDIFALKTASDKPITDKYLTEASLLELINMLSIKDSNGNYIEEMLRDRLIIVFMGLEGLRTVEIHGMNVEDIGWETKTIFIRGQKHSDFIYPDDEVLSLLQQYLQIKQGPIPRDKSGTPVFTIVSHNNQFSRISRQSIRKAINALLKKAHIRTDNKKNYSCHLLRHTCGSLIYNKTKDLQLVQETMRHRDLKTSSKYAKWQKEFLKQYTKSRPLKNNNNKTTI